jgi:hypothetical protein
MREPLSGQTGAVGAVQRQGLMAPLCSQGFLSSAQRAFLQINFCQRSSGAPKMTMLVGCEFPRLEISQAKKSSTLPRS